MKLSTLLPLAALSTAIVIPEESVIDQIAIESHDTVESFFKEVKSKVPSKEDVIDFFDDSVSSLIETSENTLDEGLDWISDNFQAAASSLEDEYFDLESWHACASAEVAEGPLDHDHPPHHHRPDRGGKKGKKGKRGGKHGKRPGKKPRHHKPHHPHRSNKTVYELISESKYSTKLAELINDDDYLVDLLNGTTANFTIFVPIDKAFEKIPKHGKDKKPPKEIVRKVLTHHISPEYYPAGRILVTRTVPTLLDGEYLSESPESTPQRLSTNIGLRGLTVDYYSRVVGANLVRHCFLELVLDHANLTSSQAMVSSTLWIAFSFLHSKLRQPSASSLKGSVLWNLAL